MVDVTVHIDEDLNESQRELLVGSLRDVEGVDSVISHDDRPHLMVVVYDAARTNSREIHRAITYMGLHGELLGL